ncbi:TlpA family protein disulfide reductase [Christensenellaceae bacterium OttesenSCG-928-K19]|nr:TlpA family protein disulfide reductase [Christensenellaceae bacterium OttesenSCG-928-K19]
MKKRILIVMIALALAAIFVSCGQAEESKNQMLGEIPGEYKIGDTPVDFEVELMDGEVVRLSDLQGKVVFLNFWFLDCPPCVAEMPAFQKLQEEYGDDLVVLAVNHRDRKEKIEAFIEENGYTFDIGLDPAGAIKIPVNGFPYTLILDRDGVISFIGQGALDDAWEPMYEEYQPEIEKLV